MRVLFLCIPGRGRFEVLSPLAQAFAGAGHALRFAVPTSFAPLVRRAGFDVLEAGQDVPALQRQLRAAAAPADSVAERAVAMFASLYPEALLADLLPQLAQWAPQLVVHEEGEFSAPLAAALAGVPCVTVGWPVALKPAAVTDRVTAALEPLWRARGRTMPHWGGLYTHFIDTCPPALQSADPVLAALSRLARMQAVTAAADERCTDADLGIDGSGRPVVHVTLGTVDDYNNAPELVHKVLAGLAGEPVQVLLTTGEALAGLDVARYPNVRAFPFLPHRVLLPRCAAVVCHGGAGSTIAALAHGLPLLVIPRGGASQYRAAVHGARAGVAIHLPEADASPETVRAAVQALLGEPAFRHAATRLRDEIRAMPPPSSCVAPALALAR